MNAEDSTSQSSERQLGDVKEKTLDELEGNDDAVRLNYNSLKENCKKLDRFSKQQKRILSTSPYRD